MDLIKELGLEKLSDEGQAKLLKEVNKTLWQRIFLVIAEKLSDDEAKKLNHYLEKSDFDEADKYLNKIMPDSMEILKKEVDLFRKELISSVSQ